MDEFRCVESIRFTDAKAFLEYLRPTNPVWEAGVFNAPWIFRGQSNAAWPLQPSAWRGLSEENALKPLHELLTAYLTESPLPEMEQELSRFGKNNRETAARDYFVHTAVEFEAVYRFSDRADQLGLHIPAHPPLMTALRFLHSLASIDILRFARNPAFALAQHHGIPTRLLDWTRKSLTAAFFAMCDGGTKAEHDMAVWAFNTSLLSNDEQSLGYYPLRLFTCPRSQHNFLHAQDGVFLFCDNTLNYFTTHHAWPKFEELVEKIHDPGTPPPLRKITLEAGATLDLMVLLWKERITSDHLMPTYDNVAKAVKRELQFERILTE